MRTKLALVSAVVGLFLLGRDLPLSAHHAFAAEFDSNKPVKFEGTVTKMQWTNPHVWVYVDVKKPDGKIANFPRCIVISHRSILNSHFEFLPDSSIVPCVSIRKGSGGSSGPAFRARTASNFSPNFSPIVARLNVGLESPKLR